MLLRPVLDQFLELYCDVNLWVVSNQSYQSLFNYNERIKFIGVDLKKSVFKIYQQVKNESKFINFEGIYDFHDVIRSKSLCFLLKNKTRNIRVFIKDRATKQKIITHKIDLKKLKHTSERYLDCLKQDFPELDFKKIKKIWSQGKNKKNTIGIAPFSSHESKQWPLKNYAEIINKYDKFHFILFAFGEKEIAASKDQFLSFKNVELISKNLSLTEQMEIINKCKVFISLDSANMHLASLTSTPVVSIWGPTHPFLGFSPLFNDEYIVQLNKEELPCRPCSVYGKIRNKYIDCAKKSMIKITPEVVLEKVDLALKN